MIKQARKTKQIDAKGQTVGRVATQVVKILRGKDKADYQPHIDNGDMVEVINCSQLKFTGKKLAQNKYIWHTMHPGGLKTKKVADVFSKDPGEVLRRAVEGMLPDNKTSRHLILRLETK